MALPAQAWAQPQRSFHYNPTGTALEPPLYPRLGLGHRLLLRVGSALLVTTWTQVPGTITDFPLTLAFSAAPPSAQAGGT